MKEFGVQEMSGAEMSERIRQYAIATGLEKVYTNDEIAWCALFASFVCRECNCIAPKTLGAIDFMNYGKHIFLEEAEQGDIVIFFRDGLESWKSHVSFFVAKRGDKIFVLGGNQSNEVNISAYPASKLRGIRRLSEQLAIPVDKIPANVRAEAERIQLDSPKEADEIS